MSNYSTFDTLKTYLDTPIIGEKLWLLTDATGGPTTLNNGNYIKTGLTYLQASYPELFNVLGHTGGTWYLTQRTSGTTSSILSMCFGNNLYVYAGAGGVTGTSTDASTWSTLAAVATGSSNPIDYSTNQKTITFVGNPQLSTAQSKSGGYSLLFNGSTDYLTIPSSADWAYGTGDFTIEFWANWSAVSSTIPGTIIAGTVNGTTIAVYITSTALQIARNNVGGDLTVSSTQTTGVWNHYAFVRSSGTGYIFKDGILLGSGPVGTNFQQSSLIIGAGSMGTSYVNGYLDDIRITKGVARYTASFIPPPSLPDSLAVDPSFSSVSLLLKMEPNKTFADLSPNSNTLTLTGNVRENLSTSSSTTGSGSIYFDGNGDYISAPNSSIFGFGTGDFTVECWVRTTSKNVAVIDTRTADHAGIFIISPTTGRIGYYDPSVGVISGTTDCSTGTWNHLAWSRSGTTFRMFVNGIQEYSGNLSSDFGASRTLRIAANYLGSDALNGNIEDIRVIKGTAKYTTNFTPPSDFYRTDPNFSNTILLIDADNAPNNSTTFIDRSSLSQTTVTSGGTTQISTTQSRFGGASAYIDGTANGGLTCSASSAFAFGTEDFTIEFWIYKNATNGTMFYSGNANSSATGLHLWTSGGIGVAVGGVNLISNAGSMPTLSWIHVAVTRSGNTIRAFLNGTVVGSTSNSTNFTDSNCRIGMLTDGSDRVNAYFDEYRVTKGIARYVANFTAPTLAYPDSVAGGDPYFNNVVLLLHMDGVNGSTTFTNNSSLSFNNVITPAGGAKISTSIKRYGTGSIQLNGSTDFLTIPGSPRFRVPTSTTPFTIECWVYPVGNTGCIFSEAYTGTGNSISIVISMADGTNMDTNTVGLTPCFGWWSGSAWTTAAGSNTAFTLNTWTHLACVFTGSTTRIFMNGVDVTKASSPVPATTWGITGLNGDNWFIGRRWDTAVNPYFNGFIDDFRFTMGVARYTANFTPPTPHFSGNDTAYTNTSLLIPGDPINNIVTSISGSGTTGAINSIIFGNGLYVYGDALGGIGTSTNGISWTTRTSGTANSINAVHFGNGIYVYAGAGGVLATSTDAITWVSRTSGTASTINALLYANNIWLYAGAGGVLATSTDAVTWTLKGSGTTAQIFSLTYANGMYWYGAASGQVGNSSDSNLWFNRNIGTTSGDVRSIINANGYYVAAGTASSTTMGTSIDGVTWSRKNLNDTDVFSVLYNNGIYIYAGASGRIRTGTDLLNATGGTTYNFNTEFAVPAVTTNNSINLVGISGGSAKLTCYVRAKV